jgi:hypothetical protein
MRILFLVALVIWAFLKTYRDVSHTAALTANNKRNDSLHRNERSESVHRNTVFTTKSLVDSNQSRKMVGDTSHYVSVNEYNCFVHIEFPEESRAISNDSTKPTSLQAYVHGDTLVLTF